MTARTYRPLMMAAAALMALLGAGAFILSSSSSASARNRYTIEITDTGFNPSVCNINRDDEVVWKNVGTKVRRVIKPDVGIGGDPLFDTGDILPGETTRGALILNAGTAWTMYDKYDPSISGIVESPGRSNTGTVSCSPAPPTPTPSPTPSVSPTATASPSPMPSPTPSPTPAPAVPPRCVGMPGCAVGAALAADK